MPYPLAVLSSSLVVGDTAKSDTRRGVAERDASCWPYGLSSLGSAVAVTGNGNSRILIGDAAP